MTATIHKEKYPFMQKSSIKSIMFLTTPQRGSDSAEWATRLANISNASLFLASGLLGSARTDLLAGLEKNSEALRRLCVNFASQTKNIKIASFYETEMIPVRKGFWGSLVTIHVRSPIVQRLVRVLLNEQVVDKGSAIFGWREEASHPMMGCNHQTVCRFGKADDQNYRKILAEIQDLIG